MYNIGEEFCNRVTGKAIEDDIGVTGNPLLPVTPKSIYSIDVTGNRCNSMCARADDNLPVTIKQGQSGGEQLILRPWQEVTIETLRSGRDVQAIAPTSSGKSFPAYIIAKHKHERGPGIVLGIMPLKALITDQEKHCRKFGLHTAVWNGDVSDDEKAQIADKIDAEKLDILLTTAESLECQSFQELLCGRVFLAWVDESHTATSKRHFRVSWGRIGQILDRIRPVVRYACTATLPLGQQQELIIRCGLLDPHIIRQSPTRANLIFEHIERSETDLARLLRIHVRQKIIIYSATVRSVECLAARFRCAGYQISAYHGRLNRAKRQESQTAFTSGRQPIIVATDSFGEGVNIPDIRAIICFDPFESIDAFTQAAGRAGRDGQPSTIYICSQGSHLGWDARDFLINTSFPPNRSIEQVHIHLSRAGRNGILCSQTGIAQAAGVPNAKYFASAIFRWLIRQQLVQHLREGREFRYFGVGRFGAVNWQPLLHDRDGALRRFEQLRHLWSLPAEQFPSEIENYFGADPGLGGALSATPRSAIGDIL